MVPTGLLPANNLHRRDFVFRGAFAGLWMTVEGRCGNRRIPIHHHPVPLSGIGNNISYRQLDFVFNTRHSVVGALLISLDSVVRCKPKNNLLLLVPWTRTVHSSQRIVGVCIQPIIDERYKL
jgi:hypothetical protein